MDICLNFKYPNQIFANHKIERVNNYYHVKLFTFKLLKV